LDLTSERGTLGVELVELGPCPGIAVDMNLEAERLAGLGNFRNASHCGCALGLQCGERLLGLLNLVHPLSPFVLRKSQCSRVSNHSAVTPPAFPFCAVAKIRRIRSCALSTSSTACRRAGEGSCVSRIAAMTLPNARRISSAALVVSGSSSSSIMIIHHWFVRFLRHAAHVAGRLLRHATPPHVSWPAAPAASRRL